MKKYLLFLAAIAAAAMMQTRCSQFQVELDNPATEAPAVATGMVAMSFSAAFDPDEAFTKTELGTDADSKKVPTWKQGDKIAIFVSFPDSTSAGPYIFTATSDGQTTDFQGTVPDGANAYYAVYPATAAQSIAISSNGNGGLFAAVASVVIPCEQEAVAGSFDPNAMLSAAMNVSADSKLYFRSVGALLRFQVSRDDIVAVRFSSAKNMSGSISATIRNQSSYLSVAEDGTGTLNKEVFVKAPAGTTFEAGKDYYAVIRARSDHASFAAEMLTEDYLLGAKRANSTLSISRAHILPLGTLDSNPTEAFIKDNYTAFQWGYDVEIGGQVYNRATYIGDAIAIDADSQGTTSLRTNLNNVASRILFLSSSGGIFNSTASSVTISSDIVIANRRDTPVTIQPERTWNLQTGSLVLSGLTLDLSQVVTNSNAAANFLSNGGGDGTLTKLIVDHCNISGMTKQLFATNSAYINKGISQVSLTHNTFAMGISTNLFTVANNATTISGWASFRFENNLIYSTTGSNLPTSIFYYTGQTSSSGETTTNNSDTSFALKFFLCNNLFYNVVTASGTVRCFDINSIQIDNNLAVVSDGTNLSNNNMKFFSLTSIQNKTYSFSGSASDNKHYGTFSGSTSKWSIADSKYVNLLTTNSDSFTTCTEYPFVSDNPLVDGFERKSAYSAYGPQ